MSKLSKQYLEVTTDGSGDGTKNDTLQILGRLYAIKWIDGDFADGVDAVLTAVGAIVDTTLSTLTNANTDGWFYANTLKHDLSGSALTGTAGGDRAMPVIDGKLKLVVSSGGATKTGGCIVYYMEN